MNVKSLKTSWKFVRKTTPMYIKSRFQPVPFWVHLYVTRKCNLACDYCQLIEYSNVTNPKKQDLDTEHMKRVLDKLYALGCRFVSYFGGEPTIRKDLPELIAHADKLGMFNHISTNGAFLTPSYIDTLGEAGLNVFNLSVDSVLEFSHSKKDLSQCKQVLLDLIEGRKKHGFEINVNMVLTSQNMDTTIPTVHFINDLNIPISVAYINSQDTYSRAPLWDFEQEGYIPESDLHTNRTARKREILARKKNPNTPSVYFETPESKAQVVALIDELIALKRAGVALIEPYQYYEDMKKFVYGELEDWNCGAGRDHLSIDSDGKVALCASSPTEKLSVFDLDKDWHKVLARMRDARMHDGFSDEYTQGCKKVCLSNCLYTSSHWISNPLSFYKDIFST